MTDFHHLMLVARMGDADSINAIVSLLTSSLGKWSNTNLMVKDSKGRTPLDYLLANPEAAQIIKAINAKEIKGYTGAYKVHHFFKNPNDPQIMQTYDQAKALGKEPLSPKPK